MNLNYPQSLKSQQYLQIISEQILILNNELNHE